MQTLSHLSYYSICGLLYCILAAGVYNAWDYYGIRIQDQIVCPAHFNVQLLCLLWLCEGVGLLACFASLWSFTGREHQLQDRSPLSSYVCVFLKVCPLVVKLLQLFNLCQLSTICLDLLLLHECNDANVRVVFGKDSPSLHTRRSAIAIPMQWLVCIVGLVASAEVFLPPYLYDPSSTTRSYWMHLKVRNAFY